MQSDINRSVVHKNVAAAVSISLYCARLIHTYTQRKADDSEIMARRVCGDKNKMSCLLLKITSILD